MKLTSIAVTRFLITSSLLFAVCGCSKPTPTDSNAQASNQADSSSKRYGVLKPVMAEHPFAPAVERAKTALKKLDGYKDYTGILIKRERIKGELQDYGYFLVKIRHQPFSVYLKFLSSPIGREVIYVEGKYDNQIVTHTPQQPKGTKVSTWDTLAIIAGTKKLKPDSIGAMIGNRYPITKIGLLTMTKELIEVGEADMKHDGGVIKYYNHATVNDIPVKAFRFIHPEKKHSFRFNVAEVFMDQKTGLPMRYAAYHWPKEKSQKPVLVEEYTYLKLKFNVGLTDDDFDYKSKQYHFPPEKKSLLDLLK